MQIYITGGFLNHDPNPCPKVEVPNLNLYSKRDPPLTEKKNRHPPNIMGHINREIVVSILILQAFSNPNQRKRQIFARKLHCQQKQESIIPNKRNDN